MRGSAASLGEEFLFALISQLVQETAKCGGAKYYEAMSGGFSGQ